MKDPCKRIISNMHDSSRRRHTGVSITASDIRGLFELQEGKDYWTHVPIQLESVFERKNINSISIDRLNNTGHYCLDNIVLTNRFVNLGRNTIIAEDFKDQIETMCSNIVLEALTNPVYFNKLVSKNSKLINFLPTSIGSTGHLG